MAGGHPPVGGVQLLNPCSTWATIRRHEESPIPSAQIVLTGVVVYYVARQIWGNWDQVKQFEWQFDIVYLLLSLICAMISLVVFSAAWVKVISAFGHILSQPSGFRILNLSILAGTSRKIWQVFGMLYYAKQKNIPEEQAAASLSYTNCLRSASLLSG